MSHGQKLRIQSKLRVELHERIKPRRCTAELTVIKSRVCQTCEDRVRLARARAHLLALCICPACRCVSPRLAPANHLPKLRTASTAYPTGAESTMRSR